MIEVGKVKPDDLTVAWFSIQPIIEEHGAKWLEEVNMREIFANAIAQRLDIWMGTDDNVPDMVGVCCWEQHAHKSYYHILWLGGRNLEKYIDLGLSKVEQYASLIGADQVRIGGREGWERVLGPRGYNPVVAVELQKNVKTLWSN